MTEIGMPLLDRDTSKANYGAPVFNQWRVAIDAYEQVMLNWDVFIRYVWEQAHARQNLTKNVKEME